MRVQRVLLAGSAAESWTVLDTGHRMVEPAEAFLAHLSAVERSPNTVRAYALDLRDFFVFLDRAGRDWAAVTVEDLGRFVQWLRLPPGAGEAGVVALPSAPPARCAATVNRKLSAVTAFYLFHERRGVPVAAGVTRWRSGRGGSWRPLLAHLGDAPRRGRAVGLPAPRRAPRALTGQEVAAVLSACVRGRDRLLVTVLRDTGLRIGEALGLRHEDVEVPAGQVWVRRRVNANGARAKTTERAVPAPVGLFRLYADYLHEEYGPLDSDYVFITLTGPRPGSPWRYDAAHDLLRRLARRSGVGFSAHLLRHTYATELLSRGVPAEVVQRLLGHASYATTVDTYAHLRLADARRALERVGWLEPAGTGW